MRGGYRQNAGRKQGMSAKNAEEARRVLSEMTMKEIEPIGKALISKAKKGDIMAARELFDRAFGRAPQATSVDLSSGQKPIPILDIFNKEARDKSMEAINTYLSRAAN